MARPQLMQVHTNTALFLSNPPILNPPISKSRFYRIPYSVLIEQRASRYIDVTEPLQPLHGVWAHDLLA